LARPLEASFGGASWLTVCDDHVLLITMQLVCEYNEEENIRCERIMNTAMMSLRSTNAPRLSVPWIRTETAKRAFCVAAPIVWNSLPNDIRYGSSLSSFRAKLKTHFAYSCIQFNIMALYKSFYITLLSNVA